MLTMVLGPFRWAELYFSERVHGHASDVTVNVLNIRDEYLVLGGLLAVCVHCGRLGVIRLPRYSAESRYARSEAGKIMLTLKLTW